MERPQIVKVDDNKTSGGNLTISYSEPYSAAVTIKGSSDFLFHRWNCEGVAAKAAAGKNSKAKKTDDIESYVWRNEEGELCIPGEYVRMSILYAAKFKQDPRSPRKSAMDLFKAGVVSTTQLASLKVKSWDYLDTRRVQIQRNGINRTRPAMKVGWEADFQFEILTPEWIDQHLFREVISMAGRLVGIGDFRPTYGRFSLNKFEIL